MKLLLSLSALGLAAGGVTTAAVQSSCTAPCTAQTMAAAPTSNCCAVATTTSCSSTTNALCSSSTSVSTCSAGPNSKAPMAAAAMLASGSAQSNKVAERAAQLEALADGGEGVATTESAPHSQERRPKVFRYQGGQLAPVNPNAPLETRPAQPPARAPKVVQPCEPAAPCAPAAPSAPPATAKSRVKVRALAPNSTAPSPELRAKIQDEREGAEHARAKMQRDAERMRAEGERMRADGERMRAEAERVREQAQGEMRRAQERVRNDMARAREEMNRARAQSDEARERVEVELRERERSQRKARNGAAADSNATPRERELEQRVRELEERLRALEGQRGSTGGGAGGGMGGARGGNARVIRIQPGAGAFPGGQIHLPNGIAVAPAAPSDDADCSPSRVRIYSMQPGQHGVAVITGPDGEARFEAFGEQAQEWSEELAEQMGEWAEEVAERQAEWAEEFAEQQAQWAEQLAEHQAQWAEQFEEFDFDVDGVAKLYTDGLVSGFYLGAPSEGEEAPNVYYFGAQGDGASESDEADEPCESIEVEQSECESSDVETVELEGGVGPVTGLGGSLGRTAAQSSQVPLLSQLPVVGGLFKPNDVAAQQPAGLSMQEYAPLLRGALTRNRLAVDGGREAATEELRGALRDMQAEVEQLRSALRELRTHLQERRGDANSRNALR